MAEYTLDDITQNAIIDALDAGVTFADFERAYRVAQETVTGRAVPEDSQLIGRMRAYWDRVLVTRATVEGAVKFAMNREQKAKPKNAPRKSSRKNDADS